MNLGFGNEKHRKNNFDVSTFQMIFKCFYIVCILLSLKGETFHQFNIGDFSLDSWYNQKSYNPRLATDLF